MKKIDQSKIKTWFVTGASSGIGKELCTQLLKRNGGGYNVIAVSRRTPKFEGENVLNLSVDVTDVKQIKVAIEKGIKHFGSIDVLANIAGIGSYLSFEEETPEEMKNVMETNFWGTYNTCKSLIPYFRTRSNGTIINMSSGSGLAPRSFGSAYCSSKYALEGLSSVLQMETKSFCRVLIVEVAKFFGTEIGKNKPHGATKYEEYKKLKMTNSKTKDGKNHNRLDIAVKYIIDEAEKEKPQRRLMLGKEIIGRVQYEIESIKEDLKKSKKRAYKCADKHFEIKEKTDYIIVNFWNSVNYGASLTAYALQELIKSLGFDCLLLNHDDFWDKELYKRSFSKSFADNFLHVSNIYHNKDLKKFSQNAKGVILGSDQVLRLDFMGHNLYKYLLNWVDDNTKKIALSASFGLTQNEFEKSKFLTPAVKEYMQNALKSFNFLSSRELSGKEIYQNIFGLNAEFILDPVFLIDKSKYEEILSLSEIDNKNKIVAYILDDKPEYQELYAFLSQKIKSECVIIDRDKYEVEDWLKSIKECKLLVTDSFHGVCFAIIFNKPFVCVRNTGRGNTRLDTLIELLGIGKNFISSSEEIAYQNHNFDCDWEEVEKRLRQVKEESLKKARAVLCENASNNPYATENKKENNAYLKGLEPLFRAKMLKYCRVYLKCKLFSKITFGKTKLHYQRKKQRYKNLIRTGGNLL